MIHRGLEGPGSPRNADLEHAGSRKRPLVPVRYVEITLEVRQLSLVQSATDATPQRLPMTESWYLAGLDRLPVPLQVHLVLVLDKNPLVVIMRVYK